MDPRQLQERIARAKEAARLASIAAAARPGPPPPRPPAPPGPRLAGSAPFGSGPPPMARPPPPYASLSVPDEVRRRIDHLVEFVGRNGPAFEETVKQRERENPSFAFLRPGGAFHDYYQWRKSQPSPRSAPQGFGGPRAAVAVPRGPVALAPAPGAAITPVASSQADPMSALAVGAMANVCRLARASGVQPYTPIPLEVVANLAALPPVEPGRLEIRLDDFYRAG